MHSPSLSPAPSPETAEIVRGRAAVVRRQRRRTAGAVAVVLVTTGLLVGPGIPDRLLPAGRRSPPAVAAPALAEPTGQALLQVSYAPGSYSSVATEEAVAGCVAPTAARVRLLAPTPAHVVTATGTPEELVALRACLEAIPGATVTDVV